MKPSAFMQRKMNYFALLLPLVAAIHAPVVDVVPNPGFTAGRAYCAMRNNGASHEDALVASVNSTNIDKLRGTLEYDEEKTIFVLVVLNECTRFKKDF